MSDPKPSDGSGDPTANAVAKTAGFLVFSGIAISILKSLNPLNRNRNETKPLAESTRPIQMESQPPRPEEPVVTKPITCVDQTVPKPPESSHKTVEIVKGDTLWELSRKHGVSIDAIKEANGLTGDTIYAGKKLTIP
ncbi:hypothetical protein UlMin_020542 [Ulmus minor]